MSSDESDGAGSEEIEFALVQDMQRNASPEPERTCINNETALVTKLESFALLNLPFEERLVCTTSQSPQIDDVHDDLKREIGFYNQTLTEVKTAIKRFTKSDMPFQRPHDYYAEMVKSDIHMKKVKERLVSEQTAVSRVEDRKRRAAERKFAKKAHSERIQEKAFHKRSEEGKIKQWKADPNRSTTSLDTALSTLKKKEKFAGRPTKGKKRLRKDAKFGFGKKGKRDKKGSKLGFGNKGKKASKKHRPGKLSRQQSRGQKKRKKK
eukprot:809294_1